MKKWLLIVASAALVIVVVGAVLAYAAMGGFAGPLTPEEATVKLETLLRETVTGDEALRNGVLLVDAPMLGVEGA